MVQSVKFLLCKYHKDLSSTPRAHILKKLGMAVHTCNPSNGEEEKGGPWQVAPGQREILSQKARWRILKNS